MQILLPKERYWDIPDTEEIKFDILETTRFQDKDEGEIQKASKGDDEIQAIKRNLDKGEKDMKRLGLGLCQWRDDLLYFQGQIWIPNHQGIRMTLIIKHHDPPPAHTAERQKTT